MKKLAIANLKMNLLSPRERDLYLKTLAGKLAGKKLTATEIVLCPPVVHLEALEAWKKSLKGLKLTAVKSGAQNVFPETKGAYTGEISPEMLRNFGCEFVILGHSERRRYFSENNQEINLKVLAALKAGLTPVLCVGENKNEEMSRVVVGQLRECLAGVSRNKIEKMVLCYEPVWAISANNPDHLPTTNEIMSARLLVKKFVVDNFGAKTAERVPIIYGGSVAADNVAETCVDSGMDGGLIGKDSLTPHNLVKIAEALEKSS